MYVAKSRIQGWGSFSSKRVRPGTILNTNMIGRYGCNHSCDPNAIMARISPGVSLLVAVEIISKDEEVTVDYRHGERRMSKKLMSAPPQDCRPCRCSICKNVK